MKRFLHIICLVLASCSTTKRLAEDETLYTGVTRMELTGEKLPAEIDAAVRAPMSVKPNNPLLSPYVRTPLPIGLWAWNAFYTERQTGFRAWLLRNFAKKPVLMNDIKPELRVGVVGDILDNHGYFGSHTTFTPVPRGKKRVRLQWNVAVPQPWHYGNVTFPTPTSIDRTPRQEALRKIDSLAATSMVRTGARYDVDTLTNERIRITNALRDEAYYYFRPEYLEYLADTTAVRGQVQLRMTLAADVPEVALKPYEIGDVNIRIYNNQERGRGIDTAWRRIKIWYQEPLRVRPKIFRRALTVIPNRPARVEAMNETLTRLTKMGIFRYVNLTATPLDSLKLQDSTIDLTFSMAMDSNIDAEIEGDFSYLSNSFIGPRASVGLTHKNFLRGGERFSVKFHGGYEWQTGGTGQVRGSAINSYEAGASASLMLPRVVGPGVLRRRFTTRFDNRSTYQISGNILNRPQFFRMMTLGGSFAYDFQTSARSFHNLTPFRLTFNKMLSTTAAFNQRMLENEAIRRSFEDQLIASMTYTYTWNKPIGRDRMIWQSSVTSAGNVLAGIFSTGKRTPRPHKVFGNPFSQFVKATTEFKYYKALGSRMTLASRVIFGAAHAYGNWPYMPYTEMFTIGGANSIRAFTIRSLGPGSYRPDASDRFGYFDQAGTFKFEANIEARFHIVAGLNGAIFLDAGNIFLLKDDPDRPGGTLKWNGLYDRIATGTGAGLRYDLGFFVIRADAGIGLHLPWDTGRSGYYNIPAFRQGLGLHLAIGMPF